MTHNPFEDTFDEYILFHKSVVKDAEQTSSCNKLIESTNTSSISDEDFMKSHGLTELDKFLKSMNEKYGI